MAISASTSQVSAFPGFLMYSFEAIPIYVKNKKIKSSPSVAVLSLGRSNDLVIWAFPSSKLHSTMIREHLNCHGSIKKRERKQALALRRRKMRN